MKEEKQEIITVVITTLLTGIIVAIGTKYNNNSISLFQGINSSIIDVGAWDISFNNINKLLFELDKNKYIISLLHFLFNLHIYKVK